MANEFIIKNGYFSQGSSNITGSLNVTAGITGSLFGTASWAQNAITASFITTAQTASTIISERNITNANFFPTFVDSNNNPFAAERLYTSTITYNPALNSMTLGSVTASLLGTASSAASASYAITASNATGLSTLNQNVVISGSLGVTGSLVVSNTSASVTYTAINTINNVIQKVDTTLNPTAINVIDWNLETLNTYDFSNDSEYTTVDWNNRILYTPGTPYGVNRETVDWGNRNLKYNKTTLGGTPSMSIDWGAGTLNNTNGSTALQWNTPGILTVTGSLIISGSATALNVVGNTTITGSLNVTQNITGSGLLITGSTSTDLVRITQTGTGNAFVVEDSTTPDTSKFVIDASGYVGIGGGIDPTYKLYVNSSETCIFGQSSFNNGVQGNGLIGVVGDGATTGVQGNGISVGVEGNAGQTDEFGVISEGIGGKFAANTNYGSFPAYSVQLQDTTEGIGKVLVSQTSDGKANWSTKLSGAYEITGSLAISGSVKSQSCNTISSDALLQATLLYLSNNF